MMKNFKTICNALLACTLLSGCSDKEVILKGEQIPVLTSDTKLDLDTAHAHIQIKLPAAVANTEFSHEAFNAAHNMTHFALGHPVAKCFDVSIGSGSSHEHRLLASPIIGPNFVYTFDARGTVKAFNKDTGKCMFSVSTRPSKENVPIGHGGLAYGNGTLFVASGYAQLLALDATTGTCLWRQELSAPARSAPTLGKEYVYVTSVDNIISAHRNNNGELAWSYTGLSENAGLLGLASPALHQDTLIVPFSSGEVIALNAHTGQPIWGEALTTMRKADAVTNIATIKAQPVIDGQHVYVVGHAGRTVALNLKTGELVWEKLIGGTQTPLVMGNVIYVMSTRAELLCLHKTDGKILWKKQLDATLSTKKEMHWQGPVLAGGHLLLTNSAGQLAFIDPLTGTLTQCLKIGQQFELGPVVAHGMLYLLSDRGTLWALR